MDESFFSNIVPVNLASDFSFFGTDHFLNDVDDDDSDDDDENDHPLEECCQPQRRKIQSP